MSWLIDLEKEKKEKKSPKSKPKTTSKPKPIVTHTYPRTGEHTVKVKDLLDINVTSEEIQSNLTTRSELTNWLTRNYGKSGKVRMRALEEFATICNKILLEKIKALL